MRVCEGCLQCVDYLDVIKDVERWRLKRADAVCMSFCDSDYSIKGYVIKVQSQAREQKLADVCRNLFEG